MPAIGTMRSTIGHSQRPGYRRAHMTMACRSHAKATVKGHRSAAHLHDPTEETGTLSQRTVGRERLHADRDTMKTARACMIHGRNITLSEGEVKTKGARHHQEKTEGDKTAETTDMRVAAHVQEDQKREHDPSSPLSRVLDHAMSPCQASAAAITAHNRRQKRAAPA
jgi:hypothetical protein